MAHRKWTDWTNSTHVAVLKRIAELEAKVAAYERTDMLGLQRKVERLEKLETVVRQLIDGSHPCFVANHEMCKHAQYGYEGCEYCYDEALLAALEGKQDG